MKFLTVSCLALAALVAVASAKDQEDSKSKESIDTHNQTESAEAGNPKDGQDTLFERMFSDPKVLELFEKENAHEELTAYLKEHYGFDLGAIPEHSSHDHHGHGHDGSHEGDADDYSDSGDYSEL